MGFTEFYQPDRYVGLRSYYNFIVMYNYFSISVIIVAHISTWATHIGAHRNIHTHTNVQSVLRIYNFIDCRLQLLALCSYLRLSSQNILQYVNKQVRRADNRQRLAGVQAKMDCSAMEKAQHPIAQLFKVCESTHLVKIDYFIWLIWYCHTSLAGLMHINIIHYFQKKHGLIIKMQYIYICK